MPEIAGWLERFGGYLAKYWVMACLCTSHSAVRRATLSSATTAAAPGGGPQGGRPKKNEAMNFVITLRRRGVLKCNSCLEHLQR